MQKDLFDKWEHGTNIIKNIGSILGVTMVIGIIVISSPDIKTIATKLSELVGLKLYNELNKPERVAGQKEIPVTTLLREAAQSLVVERNILWIYAGATRRKTKEPWLETNINVSAVPQVGDFIEVVTDVFTRAREPQKIDGVWFKGEIQGALQNGQTVIVRRVVEVPGLDNNSLWWAQVTQSQTTPSSNQ
ncbi:MAG: hypothetical protein A3B34_02590 [Candidatus Sungbacteria bacterium RIFCSPLOWO2_01_FULL_54_21]|uniref:Uncharacterized protein n=1 Tax=Candidatus Sungbacteria bacterium RIFCSPLOWO2_01_FULL_54_21 TaxID=1802279 RepID=A0A1G2L598_9BACT|nr:MAG: hypothetical protein A3B34_02590 [Candidatus Sungbacteria bacterium RIFCSPLOWO2_01_FULL_54_21]